MEDFGLNKEPLPTEEGMAETIEDALKNSLELLRSKIGTVVISGQDKYQIAFDKIMEEKASLIARAVSEKLSQDVINAECESLVNRTNEFDSKMQDLSV